MNGWTPCTLDAVPVGGAFMFHPEDQLVYTVIKKADGVALCKDDFVNKFSHCATDARVWVEV